MVLEFIQNNMSFVIFTLALTLFLIIKRKNLQLSGPFPFLYMLMFRTSLGLKKMDRWSKKHPKVFLYLAYLSAFIGVVGVIASFIFMFWQLGFIVENEMTSGGGLVLPIKTENGLDSAVPVFYVPFWYWIIALFILATVHEFAHGVIGERFGVKIKSSGFAFLGILAPIMPAAFVEPDEKSLKSKPRWQQIAVFGAGSTSNFLFGFLFLALAVFVTAPFVDKTMTIGEISFSDVDNKSGLVDYGITSGSIISFNGEYDKLEILGDVRNLSVNETIFLEVLSNGEANTYEIQTFENPTFKGKGMIGISGLSTSYGNKAGYEFLGKSPLYAQELLTYIWFLNIAIGFMNLLPLWITDGGQIARSLLEKYFGKKSGFKVYNFISFISLIIIIFTLYPSLLFKLLGLF